MSVKTDPWKDDAPADLVPALEHLRKSFSDAHWGCGRTTEKFCYALLHNEPADDREKEYINYLMAMQARVGPGAGKKFNDLIKRGTPSAVFKAFYDLYLDSVSIQALVIFKELTEIGRVNEKRLGASHLEWAEARVMHLIRAHMHKIESWVRSVCDTHVYDPNEALEEHVFWRKWQAPMLLIMEPSRFRPYDAAAAWERNDAETSSKWLKSFAEHYVLHLEVKLRRAAGEAAVALAKKPDSTPTSTSADDRGQESRISDAAPDQRRANVGTASADGFPKHEAAKRETLAMYKRWKNAYRASKKTRPEQADVWHSRKIARSEIAQGRSADTIRKHMK